MLLAPIQQCNLPQLRAKYVISTYTTVSTSLNLGLSMLLAPILQCQPPST